MPFLKQADHGDDGALPPAHNYSQPNQEAQAKNNKVGGTTTSPGNKDLDDMKRAEEWLHEMNDAMFCKTKTFLSVVLALTLGPPLAIAWGACSALVHFLAMSIFEPLVEILAPLTRSCRSLVHLLLVPVEPVVDLVSRIWPKIGKQGKDVQEPSTTGTKQKKQDLESGTWAQIGDA